MHKKPSIIPVDDDEAHTRSVRLALLGIALLLCAGFSVFGLFPGWSDAISMYNQFFPSPTQAPTRTPTQSPTVTSTATNTPTPTPNLTVTAEVLQATESALSYLATARNAANNWNEILSDPFDSNQNYWLVDTSDDEYSLATYEIIDRKYRWDVMAHKPSIGWVRADSQALTDFYLSVEVQQTEGRNTSDYGVIFREDENANFYYFGINEQGEYGVFLFFEEWQTLSEWSKTDLIRSGEVNRLTVIGEDSHFTFFLNGQFLSEIKDDTITSGSTALAIEMAAENDHSIFEFDNFELRVP